jgi:glycosyltransferase involved in cell wall biosynthesis
LINGITIAVNLRPLYPGRIGGQETYVRVLLDRWIAESLGKDIDWVLFTNKANHDTFKHLSTGCRRILLPDADYESFIFSQLTCIQPNLYFCPLLTLEPLNPPCLSAVMIPDLQHEFFPDFFSADVLRWRHSTYPTSSERAACVFTNSEFSKKTFVDKLGIPPEKIFAIHLDADDIFRRPLERGRLDEVRNKYDLRDDYIFYPANFWPHKNHEVLFHAFADARYRLGRLSLVLTGAKDDRLDMLQALARKLGIDSVVRYIGHIPKEDLPCLYRGARALVFPSLFEGFGIPIVEAFCCECPVICSNTTSCPEIAGDGALLVDPSNPHEISAAIQKLDGDESLRKKLVNTGRILADQFRNNRLAEKTLERLVAAIEENRQPTATTHVLPRMSIITPSFNQGKFIQETINSVLSQNYPDLEYWVMDGGSSDETIDILRTSGPKVQWVSEKDNGQADAVNKGFSSATGDIIGWLNSDDTYLPGTLAYVGEYFSNHPGIDVVYGDGYYIDPDGAVIHPYRTLDFSWESLAHECYICQPTVFFRRRVLAQAGALDVNLRVALDYEFWMRLFRQYPPVRLPRFLAASRMYADNKTLSLRQTAYREIIQVVRKHFGFVPYSWVLGYASYWWHRNDQFIDPKPVTAIVVFITLILMGWYNRFNLRYLWRWVTNKEHGMRSEIFRSMRQA